MTTRSPKDLITDNLELVSLPEVVIKINDMVNDPNCTAADIGDLISQDVALSTRLLNVVNSPFYSFPSQVDTISMAITIVGTRQLRDLVLSTSIISHFNAIPPALGSAKTFWQHNLATATAARCIASHLRIANTERFFVAGLLHDIGKLVMYLTQPKLSRQVLELMENPDNDIIQLESDAFGFDHAALGAELLRQWRLPDSLIEPTAYHHKPAMAQQYRKEAAIVHLANAIANTVAPAFSADDDLPIDLRVWEILGLNENDLNPLIEATDIALDNTLQVMYFEEAA